MRIRGLGAKRVVLLEALAVAVAGVLLAATFLVGAFGTKELSGRAASPRVGNARALQASYERWKTQYVATEGDRMLVLPLGYSKGLSARFTNAQGQARLDLADGTITVEVSGLPAQGTFEVWLVDNRPGPGRSVRPEPGDNLVRVGRLERAGDALALRERLARELLTGFKLDLIVVAPAGGDPGTDGLLFAAPSLFHRLYYSEQRAPVTASGNETGTAWSPFSVLVPSPAWAQAPGAINLQALVDEGARLFFDETFDGNGRTCGTCHPAENNFTIDRAFIARLPPRDPLFVAEFNPDLAQLENPVLMRRFGLILENVDGLEDPTNKFVMRGVPHTLALPISIEPQAGVTEAPFHRTGWSGDGAPGDGRLRDFATGAVTQHFTRTLARKPGEDFRLPTDAELNAMVAFQLTLGRQEELNLQKMVFSSPEVERGKSLFLTTARCNACHANAGANTSFGGGGNRNFDTGVENLPHPAASTGEPMPRDGGLGKQANPNGGFGDGTFNTTVLVEAADTPPFFHNNSVATVEDAVAFYAGPIFNASPAAAAGQIALNTAEVNAVAALLRVLNALENIRSAIDAQTGATTADFGNARSSLRFSITEVDDAIRVLTERRLHRNAVVRLGQARGLLTLASNTPAATLRNRLIGQAITQEEAAKALLVTIVP